MFLVCGEALFDFFPVSAPETEASGALRFEARLGGSPFNVALGLARLGCRSALLTGLSTDFLGARLRAALEAEGVATDHLIAKERPTTLSLVGLDSRGQPSYAFYGRDAADRALTEADLPALGPEVAAIHVGSYSLVVEPTGTSLLRLVRRESARRLISLDPNVRLTVVSDVALWRRRVADFAAAAHVIKLSSEDFESLYGDAAPESVVRGWLDAGACLVVLTRGAEGADAYTQNATATTAGVAVEVADSVGAGDGFQAALLCALDELGLATPSALTEVGEAALVRVLDFAVRASAIACARRGADLARRADLPALA